MTMVHCEKCKRHYLLCPHCRADAGEPMFVSQKTSLQVLGLSPRVFLEVLRQRDAPPVTNLGKLRLVERTAFAAWLLARVKKRAWRQPKSDMDLEVEKALLVAGARRLTADTDEDEALDVEAEVDRVLAVVGRRRVR